MTNVEIMDCVEIARTFLDDNDAKNEPLWYDENNEHDCCVGEVKEGASKAEAEEIKAKLEAEGAEVVLK